MSTNETGHRPTPPFKAQPQTWPGRTANLDPAPDHGEQSYKGSGRLSGKTAIVTGADSGIGRAVAIAYAREGADLVLSYLDEHDDAKETTRWVEEAGRKAILVAGDIADPRHCDSLVEQAVAAFGEIDIIVNNAGFQHAEDSIDDMSVDDWNRHFAVNVHAMFYIVKAAVPHMKEGGSIVNTASMNAKLPMPRQLAYSATKGAVTNFTAGLAKLLAPKGIRANAVLPGPIWTPLITSTMLDEEVEAFGKDAPLGRPGQPAELAPAYVMLASDESGYTSGAMIAVTGGTALL
jgi:NAD(P)-dependent dehydrogenase (short-subunit alcohol dehydrogenase family)